MFVKLLAGNPGLNPHVQVLRIDLQDLVHAAEVDAQPAAHSQHLALQRRTRAERNNRRPVAGANAHDVADLLRGPRKRHGIRGSRQKVRLVLAMVLTNGRSRGKTIAQ